MVLARGKKGKEKRVFLFLYSTEIDPKVKKFESWFQ